MASCCFLGADLHAGGMKLPVWKTSHRIYATMKNGKEVIGLQGHYGCSAATVLLLFRIAGDGQINIEYQLSGHQFASLHEYGLSFSLAPDVDHVRWKRKGLYSWYPQGENRKGQRNRLPLP